MLPGIAIYRRIGGEWLWFSRLRMAPEQLGAMIRHPAVEVYALTVGERDEGLIELDFREPDVCELRMFGVTAPLVGTGAGRWLMNRAIEAAWSKPIRRFWCTPAPSTIPRRSRSTSARALFHSDAKSRLPTIRASTARCHGRVRRTFRSFSSVDVMLSAA